MSDVSTFEQPIFDIQIKVIQKFLYDLILALSDETFINECQTQSKQILTQSTSMISNVNIKTNSIDNTKLFLSTNLFRRFIISSKTYDSIDVHYCHMAKTSPYILKLTFHHAYKLVIFGKTYADTEYKISINEHRIRSIVVIPDAGVSDSVTQCDNKEQNRNSQSSTLNEASQNIMGVFLRQSNRY
ncbi:hypothetical protein RF11_00422 [Thelohanellus kitauei]|uniref:Uncharacterized protein n=1 Tax=Thelohanellus kitauei TaxID=669202 RepID=A0A0C2N6K3_THEKT|nr:hypothetical protein RF11_00422 [Thelohanellus kitauei]